MTPINISEKLSRFSSHWDPHVVADYNRNDVMVVKFKGAFPFHKHDDTDDFFFVLSGRMTMEYEDRPVEVGTGEMIVIPRGTVRRPRAEDEVHVRLTEPKGEPNTGNSGAEPAPKPRI